MQSLIINRRFSLFTFALAPAMLALTAHAGAQVTHWTAPGGGSFHDANNWDDGVPGADSLAVFDLRGDIDVTFSQSATTNQLFIDDGNVSFLFSGHDLSLNSAVVWTPSLIVGGETGSVASLSLLGGDVAGGFAIIGDEGGAYGSLHLDNAAVLDLAGQVWVGFLGSGSLHLAGESSISSVTTTIGSAAGSFGEVALRDGARWDVLADVRIAQFPGSEGHVTVEGACTSWEIQGNFDLGMNDRGTLTIAEGAEVVMHGSAFVGALATGPSVTTPERAEILISGAGSRLVVGADLWIGQEALQNPGEAWSGRLTLENGGRTAVEGILSQYEGVLLVRLGASDDYLQHPAIATNSATHPLGATIEIELMDDFIPAAHDVYRIITLPSTSLTLPPIPQPLEWEIVEIGSEVQLHVNLDADLTGDASVGVADLLVLLANWGPCPDPTPGNCTGDFNFDGSIGIADLLLLLANWG